MLAMDMGSTPPALQSRPSLQTFDVEVWNAFTRLSSRRNMGGFGAVGAIPYIEITSYLQYVVKIDDPDERSTFIELIDFLDEAFLKDYAEKQKKEQAQKPKRGNRSRT